MQPCCSSELPRLCAWRLGQESGGRYSARPDEDFVEANMKHIQTGRCPYPLQEASVRQKRILAARAHFESQDAGAG